MNIARRIWNIITSLLIIACGLLFVLDPWGGYKMVVKILIFALLISGLRALVYYFTMARHSVGGLTQLYKGIILFDAGLFALSLDSVPPVYTMIYLMFCMVVSGAIDILRSNESRRMKSGRWKLQMIYGLGNVVLPLVAVCFFRTITILSVIYGVTLLHAGVWRMVNAFRKNDIAYIGG